MWRPGPMSCIGEEALANAVDPLRGRQQRGKFTLPRLSSSSSAFSNKTGQKDRCEIHFRNDLVLAFWS